MISPVIYFYHGERKLSFLRFLTYYTFKKLNPQFEIHWYIPTKITEEIPWDTPEHKQYRPEFTNYFPLIRDPIHKVDFNKIGFSENNPEVHKSDFLRLYLLYNHGGFWCDSDILWLTPWVPVSEELVLCNTRRSMMIGFFGSVSKHPYISSILKEILTIYQKDKYLCLGAPLYRKKYQPNYKAYFFGPHLLYAVPYEQINYCFERHYILPPHMLGIHWFGSYNKYEYVMTPLNFLRFETFGKKIESVLTPLEIDDFSKYEKCNKRASCVFW